MTGSESEEADFGVYMREKIRKIEEHNKTSYTRVNDIFRGCVVYVDGLTNPSNVKIRELVCSRCGEYAYYLSPKSVTHVIATQMPLKKYDQLTSSRIPIVTPEWIVACCSEERLLSTDKYLLLLGVKGSTSDRAHIENYFSKSRLHHLSEWRSMMKSKIGGVIAARKEKVEGSAAGKDDLGDEVDSVIFHIDIDSFFASVISGNNSALKSEPFVVCHSRGVRAGESASADVSCANYVARERGIRNGMWLGEALKICPNLKSVPYDFPAFEAASMKFFDVLLGFTTEVEVASCDEAYLDITNLLGSRYSLADIYQVAQRIREKIRKAIECTVSVGIGPNILLAQLATYDAKPDGVGSLSFRDNGELMEDEGLLRQLEFIPVSRLPLVGWKALKKLKDKGKQIRVLGELHAVSLEVLQDKFGRSQGLTLYQYARGIDGRKVNTRTQSQKKKSISVNMNYALRFKKMEEVFSFTLALSEELESRIQDYKRSTDLIGGKAVVLRLLLRAPDAPIVPRKYLGTGRCVSLQRSAAFPKSTLEAIYTAIEPILRKTIASEKVDIKDIRGIGIALQNLEYGSPRTHNIHKAKNDIIPLKETDDVPIQRVKPVETTSQKRKRRKFFTDESPDSLFCLLRRLIISERTEGPTHGQEVVLNSFVREMVETRNAEAALHLVNYLQLLCSEREKLEGKRSKWSDKSAKFKLLLERCVEAEYNAPLHSGLFLCTS